MEAAASASLSPCGLWELGCLSLGRGCLSPLSLSYKCFPQRLF